MLPTAGLRSQTERRLRKDLLIKALLWFSEYPSSGLHTLLSAFDKGSNCLLALELICVWEINVCLLAKPQLYNHTIF